MTILADHKHMQYGTTVMLSVAETEAAFRHGEEPGYEATKMLILVSSVQISVLLHNIIPSVWV